MVALLSLGRLSCQRLDVGLLGWGVAVASLAALASMWLRRRTVIQGHRQAELALFRAGRNDTLTRLSSRDVFIEEVTRLLAKAAPVALLLIDIDDFSGLNNRHGHRAGDEVLVALAQRLRGLSPASDHVARLGADRFGLLTTASGRPDGLETTALAVLRSLAAPIACSTGSLDCTVSIGVAMLPGQVGDADEALREAGAALDHVRASGGAGWRFYDPDRDDGERRQAALGQELRAGLSAGQVIPFYQPIIDLADRPSRGAGGAGALAAPHARPAAAGPVHPAGGTAEPDRPDHRDADAPRDRRRARLAGLAVFRVQRVAGPAARADRHDTQPADLAGRRAGPEAARGGSDRKRADRGHRRGARGDRRCCSSAARAWCWTISAPATAISPTCASCRSTASR